jgi:O-antigen chain-terminating methyltransferase
MVVDDTVQLIEELTELALGRRQLADVNRSSSDHQALTREVDNIRANADVDAMPDPAGSMRVLKQGLLRVGSFNWVRQRAVNHSLARALELLRDQLNNVQRQAELSARAAASTLATLEATVAALDSSLETAVADLRGAAQDDRERAESMTEELRGLLAAHVDGQSALRARVEHLESELAAERRRYRAVREQLGQLRSGGDVAAPAPTDRTAPTVLASPPATAERDDEWATLIEELYARFEASFRPDGDELRARFAEYLDDLGSLREGAAPVLDVGTGRGDFLGVLAQEGIPGYGVDADADAVAEARDRGLQVTEADALAFLRSVEPMSVGAVTAFHIVEHLPPGLTAALLDAALQALVPGGLLIVETPNPTNLRIGAAAFYNDPTHQRPITPTYLEWLVRDRGFGEVVTRFLHPLTGPLDTTELSAWPEDVVTLMDDVHWALRGPQDFAVLGRRPPAR